MEKKSGVYEIQSLVNRGPTDVDATTNNMQLMQGSDPNEIHFQPRVDNGFAQHWWFWGIVDNIYVIQAEMSRRWWWHVDPTTKQFVLKKEPSTSAADKGGTDKHAFWFRVIKI